ncbi:rhodanese-like domain-containing protein [Bacillus timonensis]|nr:rhodanese-like domain-containing protein [Bacillus timonensis]
MSVQKISPEQLHKQMVEKKVIVLDVRAEEKYREYHIDSDYVESINIVKTAIFERDIEALASLPKETEIVVTCTTGNSAAKCAAILDELEYCVVTLDGGVSSWKAFMETKTQR